MKSTPLLFSGPMIRALLDGRKTMTRRVVKYIPMLVEPLAWCAAARAQEPGWVHIVGDYRRFCPYGQPGDEIWCKETFCISADGIDNTIAFRADGWTECPSPIGKWTPSIFMPRAASRISLGITAVSVERVQEISEADAKAEGAPEPTGRRGCYPAPWATAKAGPLDYRASYRILWDEINGDGSWARNKFVWVISFRRVKP